MRLADPRLTLLFFLLTLAIFVVMGRYFPAELTIPLEGSTIRPVLLLEFAQSHQHLVHIFGEAGDPERVGRVAGMNTGNALDYLLMPAYAFLNFCFFSMIAEERSTGVWRVFGVMAVVAALADAFENVLMFDIVGQFVAGTSTNYTAMAWLPFPVWLKFGLLAMCCGGAAMAFVIQRRWVLALLSAPAPLLMLPAMLDPMGIGPVATGTIGLGWLAMAAYAALRWYLGTAGPDQSKL